MGDGYKRMGIRTWTHSDDRAETTEQPQPQSKHTSQTTKQPQTSNHKAATSHEEAITHDAWLLLTTQKTSHLLTTKKREPSLDDQKKRPSPHDQKLLRPKCARLFFCTSATPGSEGTSRGAPQMSLRGILWTPLSATPGSERDFPPSPQKCARLFFSHLSDAWIGNGRPAEPPKCLSGGGLWTLPSATPGSDTVV